MCRCVLTPPFVSRPPPGPVWPAHASICPADTVLPSSDVSIFSFEPQLAAFKFRLLLSCVQPLAFKYDLYAVRFGSEAPKVGIVTFHALSQSVVAPLRRC